MIHKYARMCIFEIQNMFILYSKHHIKVSMSAVSILCNRLSSVKLVSHQTVYGYSSVFNMNIASSKQSGCLNRWKKWWRRLNSKKIMLLLMWQVMSTFSFGILMHWSLHRFDQVSSLFSIIFTPFLTWFADVKFGRYEVIKFGTLVSFFAGILLYLTLYFAKEHLLKSILYLFAVAIVRFGSACYATTMLPFLTDQVIGATSDELSAVVQWYTWALNFAMIVCRATSMTIYQVVEIVEIEMVIIFAVPLAVTIISDCLCQQWLDKSHKVANPMKLIVQVINYARKHKCPKRRSALTYFDEEHPTRMDFGKEKFGGPFTEEEVEDVKTVLRLVPLVMCVGFLVIADESQSNFIRANTSLKIMLDADVSLFLFPFFLIPLYRLLLHRFIHSYIPSLFKSLGIGLLLYLVGHILLKILAIVGVIISEDGRQYFSCEANATVDSVYEVEWYWKLGPFILLGIGRTISMVLLNVLIIAQSPDKMKGFIFGLYSVFSGISVYIRFEMAQILFTMCYDIPQTILIVTLFLVYLILSKRYKLRERNKVVNIQAIVEEHHERYLDQEEEYMRQQHY